MVTITFGLIRQCHDVPVEELENLTEIQLTHRNIDSIDNLEIFQRLKVLNLAHNQIGTIQNLEFLSELEHLDLSCNNVCGSSLVEGVKSLPKGLRSINLTGNPCATDETALMQFQDAFCSLGIIVGEFDENEPLSPQDAEGDEDIEGNEEGDDTDSPNTQLADPDLINHDRESEPSEEVGVKVNADAVLKEIVDRKCRLQNIASVDIGAKINELNQEFESACSHFSSRKRNDRVLEVLRHVNNNNNCGAEEPPMSPHYAHQVAATRSYWEELQASRGDFDSRMKQMSERAMKKRGEVFAKVVVG